MMRYLPYKFFWCCSMAGLTLASPQAASASLKPVPYRTLHAADTSELKAARSAPLGGILKINTVQLEHRVTTDLVLERFQVFAPDAKIFLNGKQPLAVPTDAYFHGTSTAMPQAVVILAVPAHGPARGLITDATGAWLLEEQLDKQNIPKLSNRWVDFSKLPPFECAAAALPGYGHTKTSLTNKATPAPLAANVTHTAKVAVETDYEYFALFNDTAKALSYMGDIFAYVSTVYEKEINTNLLISYSQLYADGANSDPWSANNTETLLEQLLQYWRANHSGVERTLTHMLSGKNLHGGIAYVGVLCNKDFGYGLSASIAADFDTSNPSVVWDVLAVAHEIGHNFNSKHTHDYCGINSVADPVDLCVDSAKNCGSARGLPGIDSLSGGTPGDGTGTIMSYCHLIEAGLSDITYTFGETHQFGRQASRVPAVMRDHVLQEAAAQPSCLELQGNNQAPLVTTNPAADISITSATLEGEVDERGLDATVSFAYGQNNDYGSVVDASPKVITAGTGLTVVTATLTGLQPSTTYHYQIQAKNSAGSSVGLDQTFTTSSAPTLQADCNGDGSVDSRDLVCVANGILQ